MFNKKIIGVANATAAGWGNLGGGVTNLTMPLFFLAFMSATGQDEDRSWRLTYLVPLLGHLIGMCMTTTSQDLPDGNYRQVRGSVRIAKGLLLPTFSLGTCALPAARGE